MTALQMGMIASMQNLKKTGKLEKPEVFMKPSETVKKRRKKKD